MDAEKDNMHYLSGREADLFIKLKTRYEESERKWTCPKALSHAIMGIQDPVSVKQG